MNVGEKIKSYRKSRKLTQQELSEKTNIALASLQRYERNERQANVEILKKISNALDCNINELLDSENIVEQKNNKLILSNEIRECLRLSTNDFKVNFRTASYEQTKDLSESILSLERALSYQLQIEEKYKIESEEN